jgi:uncharacterized protein YjbI with pentapeptide repeats
MGAAVCFDGLPWTHVSHRQPIRILVVCLVLAIAATALPGGLIPDQAQAVIYRWDNGQPIPGTEGIEPGPDVDLSDMTLSYAKLYVSDTEGMDLTGANFDSSLLDYADLRLGTLIGASFTGADLDHATLTNANLNSADLTWATGVASYNRGIPVTYCRAMP